LILEVKIVEIRITCLNVEIALSKTTLISVIDKKSQKLVLFFAKICRHNFQRWART